MSGHTPFSELVRKAGIDLDRHTIVKAAGRWDPTKHPRGGDGRFIKKGDLVLLGDGSAGTVVNITSDGQIAVKREDGETQAYAPSTVTHAAIKPANEPLAPRFAPKVGTAVTHKDMSETDTKAYGEVVRVNPDNTVDIAAAGAEGVGTQYLAGVNVAELKAWGNGDRFTEMVARGRRDFPDDFYGAVGDDRTEVFLRDGSGLSKERRAELNARIDAIEAILDSPSYESFYERNKQYELERQNFNDTYGDAIPLEQLATPALIDEQDIPMIDGGPIGGAI